MAKGIAAKMVSERAKRLHQSQNPSGKHTFDEVGASAGVRLLPPSKRNGK